MEMICLERDGRGPVQFEGFELAFVSTATPNKDRWTELRLWAVENSDVLWVVETIGVSKVPGETDRRDAVPCKTAGEVHNVLCKRGQITAPGYKLMQDACSGDEDIEDFFLANIRKVERL